MIHLEKAHLLLCLVMKYVQHSDTVEMYQAYLTVVFEGEVRFP